MPVELAELAAGLPIAASFAMAGGISALREGRRRTALNEAVHELRRPLQAIALSSPAAAGREGAFESSLRMASVAIERLDREINGKPAPGRIGVVPLREVVEAAVERWHPRASREDRVLDLEWGAGDLCVPGSAVELTQALDNLISNGLDHGSGEVAVAAVRTDGLVRISVVTRQRTNKTTFRRAGRDAWARLSGRSRHGHGLRIVRRAVARSGGSFGLRRRGDRCEAVVELPVPGGRR